MWLKCDLCGTSASGGRVIQGATEYEVNHVCLLCIADIQADDWGRLAARTRNPMSADAANGARLEDLEDEETSDHVAVAL
jgi:hypothetical protein